MDPPKCPQPIHKICEHVTLYDKWDLADRIS